LSATHLSEELADLPLHVTQTRAAEGQGVEVELEVETGQLGRDMGIVDGLENLGGDGRRPPMLINQKELLLGADAAHPALEEILLEHLLECAHVPQKILEKDPDLLGLRMFSDVLLTHGCY